MKLEQWNNKFASYFQNSASLEKAGALLSVLPNHSEWDDFVADIKPEWNEWSKSLTKYSNCLIMLFAGIAFYHYDEHTFWPEFEKVVGANISNNKQNDIALVFASVAKEMGLGIQEKNKRVSYVGSAVHLIGIPLTLWDDFLEICEWASWNPNWTTMPDNEWSDVVGRRVGGRQRLKKFLVENRTTASSMIKELLEVRDILSKDQNSTIQDIAPASILRYEYFDEVPETADFFRPQNPDSLFRNRAKLIWNESMAKISVYLPAIAPEMLPAKWNIGALTQNAASSPDEAVLNAKAFTENIVLKFSSNKHEEIQRIKGINSWGLFDLGRGGCLINTDRQKLPISNYILVSLEKIEVVSRNGFEDKESFVNERFEFSDGTTCFVTYLWPIANFADITLKVNSQQYHIKFRAKLRIEARFFPARFNQAGHFMRLGNDRVKVEHLPVLCVSMPIGYFKDNKVSLNGGFKVYIDKNLAPGCWEICRDHEDSERELFFWRWEGPPVIKIEAKSRQLKDLTYRAVDLKGDRQVSISSLNFNIIYDIHLAHSYNGMDRCWKNLPGAYALWFLLCQSNQGMRWEDLVLAKDILEPAQRVSYFLLRKYAELGFIIQKGRLWKINQSRAVVKISGGKCEISYCGDPSLLWGLYRYICFRRLVPIEQLPVIEVIDKRGTPPYLRMAWESQMQRELAVYFKSKGVYLSSQLWNH